MLTVAEAAKLADRDPETIRRWIRAGRLAAWKVGGQHIIDEAALASASAPTPSRPDATAAGRRVGEAAVEYGSTVSSADELGPNPTSVPAIDARLPHVVGRIVHGFGPTRIVLFGARVHGDQRPDTEYNLLVVLDHVADRWDTAVDVRLSFAELPVFAEVLVAPIDEVEGRAERPLIDHAYRPLREGITIYERGRSHE